MPYLSQNSDPIRGPIYIELDTECLKQDKSNLFQEFAEDYWEQRLFLFRESIVKRFGFVPCTTDPNQQMSSATFRTHHQYINCTGNCFILHLHHKRRKDTSQMDSSRSNHIQEVNQLLRCLVIWHCHVGGDVLWRETILELVQSRCYQGYREGLQTALRQYTN